MLQYFVVFDLVIWNTFLDPRLDQASWVDDSWFSWSLFLFNCKPTFTLACDKGYVHTARSEGFHQIQHRFHFNPIHLRYVIIHRLSELADRNSRAFYINPRHQDGKITVKEDFSGRIVREQTIWGKIKRQTLQLLCFLRGFKRNYQTRFKAMVKKQNLETKWVWLKTCPFYRELECIMRDCAVFRLTSEIRNQIWSVNRI